MRGQFGDDVEDPAAQGGGVVVTGDGLQVENRCPDLGDGAVQIDHHLLQP